MIIYNKYMRTLFLTLSLFVASQVAFSQTWETIRYKNLLSFDLPAGYTVLDTLGSSIYQSEIDDTTYICSFMPDPEPLRFESATSVEAFYDDYFGDLLAKIDKPKIIKKEMISFGKFRALKATLQRNVIKKELTWQMLLIHVKNTTFNFQCITQNKAKAQFERVEKSIRFNDSLSGQDQISAPAEKPETDHNLEYILYTVLGLTVIFGYYLYRKNKSKKKA